MAKRLARLRRLQPFPGGSLLDLGFGSGAYTVAVANEFRSLIAVDVDPAKTREFGEFIAHTPLSSRVQVLTMAAEQLSFPPEAFDAVMAIEVLDHVTSLDRSIDEIFRVLRPGGYLYVSAPNRLFPIETHMVKIGRLELPGRYLPLLPYVSPVHHRISRARNFTAGELRSLMQRHGLAEVGVDYVMPPFDRWRLGRRLLRAIADRLETTPLRRLGVSILSVYAKPTRRASVRQSRCAS